MIDLLEVLSRLNVELYSTWQEASNAAVNLGIRNKPEYRSRYKEDPKLPSSPFKFYSDFPGYYVFLGNEVPLPFEPYPTWQEASESAIKLKIKNQREYSSRYKEDPKLPSSPFKFYSDFPGFYIFLGTAIYSTWQESSKAAIKLKIKNSLEYFSRYKEDSKLPGTPYNFYPDFPGYYIFLGNEVPVELYPTWQEASNAAIKLKIKSQDEYKSIHKEDSKLPSDPFRKYSDFPGWYIFLGKEVLYHTWQEASEAAIKMKIKDSLEYRTRHKEDPKLPSSPNKKYSDFPGYYIFLGK